MANYIDAFTGEIVEQEDQNQLIEKKLYEVGALNEQTYDFLEQYRTVEEQYEMFRYALKKGMEENGFSKWANRMFSVSITPEGTKNTFDTQRAKDMKLSDFLLILLLKEREGEDLKSVTVYDFFTKLSYTKSKINIRFKEDR